MKSLSEILLSESTFWKSSKLQSDIYALHSAKIDTFVSSVFAGLLSVVAGFAPFSQF